MNHQAFARALEFSQDTLERVRWNLVTEFKHDPIAMLLAAYRVPRRFHHTIDHPTQMIIQANELDYFEDLLDDTMFDALIWSIWFHDCVYNVMVRDNELQSAKMFKAIFTALNMDPVLVEDIFETIEMTAAATPESLELVRKDKIGAILHDLNYGIIGSDEHSYGRYAHNIASEWIPAVGVDAFLKGRLKFLDGLRRNINGLFFTEQMIRFTDQAASNIDREIQMHRDYVNKFGTEDPDLVPLTGRISSSL